MKKLLNEWKQFLESEALISEVWPGLRGKTAEIEQATRDLIRKQRQEREAPPPPAAKPKLSYTPEPAEVVRS